MFLQSMVFMNMTARSLSLPNYTRKSGDEILTQLFHFEDRGDRSVAMRPELTPTLARMAVARQRDYKKPLRWYGIGQFF